MTRLRLVALTPRGPDAYSPTNLALTRSAEPICRLLEDRLRTTVLEARYRALSLLLEPDGHGDGRLHWRQDDEPTYESERAWAGVPTELALDEEGRQRLVGRLFVAVLGRLAELRGWPPDVMSALLEGLPGSAPEPEDVPLVFEPPPSIWIYSGGGPMDDPRNGLYLDRLGQYCERFETDPAWRAWWLASGRREVDLTVEFGVAAAAVRLTVSKTRISFGLHRAPATIPVDAEVASALVRQDLQAGLDRLRERLHLEPPPPL